MQFELQDPPFDGISSVRYAPSDPNRLLVSSWDSNVRLYDTQTNQLLLTMPHCSAILDVSYPSEYSFYSAGLDGSVKSVDLNTSVDTVIGTHHDAVRCLSYSQSIQGLFSGSWDKTVKLWDHRSGHSLQDTMTLPNKVFSIDTIGHWLVVGLAGRLIHIYDNRQLTEPVQQRESSLKFMTRVIKCMPNEEGYITTSVEGRVAVEYFDPSPQWQAKKYAFKCHRQTVEGTEYIYPVNAIEYHPIAGTFVSGGGDGIINVWDGQNKKRIRQYPKYPTSIAALSFNCTGTQLAVASSYTFEEGEKDHPPDSVFIRSISEQEVKPKKV